MIKFFPTFFHWTSWIKFALTSIELIIFIDVYNKTYSWTRVVYRREPIVTIYSAIVQASTTDLWRGRWTRFAGNIGARPSWGRIRNVLSACWTDVLCGTCPGGRYGEECTRDAIFRKGRRRNGRLIINKCADRNFWYGALPYVLYAVRSRGAVEVFFL